MATVAVVGMLGFMMVLWKFPAVLDSISTQRTETGPECFICTYIIKDDETETEMNSPWYMWRQWYRSVVAEEVLRIQGSALWWCGNELSQVKMPITLLVKTLAENVVYQILILMHAQILCFLSYEETLVFVCCFFQIRILMFRQNYKMR